MLASNRIMSEQIQIPGRESFVCASANHRKVQTSVYDAGY